MVMKKEMAMVMVMVEFMMVMKKEMVMVMVMVLNLFVAVWREFIRSLSISSTSS